MKLDYAGIAELGKEPDVVVKERLLAAHQAVRDIMQEQKNDVEIQRLQKHLDELKTPYKRRLLRQRAIIAAAELVARSRGLLLPEDKPDED